MKDDAIPTHPVQANWQRERGERARAICAQARPDYAEGFLSGKYDNSSTEMRAVLLAFAQQPEGWRPIETAPKDGTSVLVTVASTAANTTYGEGGYRHVMQSSFEDELWLSYDCHQLENACWKVTHWQPLPAPPAAMLDVAPGEQIAENANCSGSGEE